MNAFAVVSDSGTLPEESACYTALGYPFAAVSIRTSTERPEALEKGCFVLAGVNTLGLQQAVALAVEACEAGEYCDVVVDYVDTNVSMKVVKIIQSYTEVVRKTVWRE